ncbi:hypothetical protein TeGR_g2869 [Tetraparma gracilis]|uniref:UDP-glucuronate decarboxylase n=1 Tax=Tetraparma gracilis TaxID=2962635 RepID=A0ABQ6N3H3_9STRA|nr:hypothetical protein TeGR_g2869 [Tetraparma gracilis]
MILGSDRSPSRPAAIAYSPPWRPSLPLLLSSLSLLSLLYLLLSSRAPSPGGRFVTDAELSALVRAEVSRALVPHLSASSASNLAGVPSSPDHAALGFVVAQVPESERLRVLVTGGAGFVGSHLVDRLMVQGHEVIVLDNFFTGRKKNVAHWESHRNFQLISHDVVEPLMLEVDQIYHLACPASPPHYQYNPVKTIKTSTMGTINMLGLAKRVKARMLLTSTSEVYGDPQVHPQPETYWGNVNPIGPRACYDEGKRVAETMMYAYEKQSGVEVRVARIFNTFGPRMHPNDGRVVSNFIIQALQGKDITIYGQGEQTRSFQFVDDLVDGLMKLMNGGYSQPVNIGNPQEFTVKKFAEHIRELTKSTSKIKYLPATEDDPTQRRPDISVAKRELNWEPKVDVKEGLVKTIEYFQSVLDEGGEIVPTGQGAVKPKGYKAPSGR